MKLNFKKIPYLLFVTLITLMMLVSACAPAPSPAPLATQFTQEMKIAYMEAAKVYSAHVALDVEKTKQLKLYTTQMENAQSETKDELAVMKLCYSNSQEFFIAALTGAFGDKGMGQETPALLNMLHVNQTYPGDVTECQKHATNIAVYMRSNRAQAMNIKGEIFRIDGQISNLELSDLKTAVIIDFYNKYGADIQKLIQSGDKAFATFVGSQNADQVLPAQFMGFPTKALQAETRDMKVCSQYQAIHDGTPEGIAMLPAGKYAYMYGVSLDSVAGICTLYQSAAEGYSKMITTPSLAALQNLQQGCTSLMPGECDATAEPKKK